MTLPSSYTYRLALPEDAQAVTYVSTLGWQQSYKGIIDQSYLDKLSRTQALQERKVSYSTLWGA